MKKATAATKPTRTALPVAEEADALVGVFVGAVEFEPLMLLLVGARVGASVVGARVVGARVVGAVVFVVFVAAEVKEIARTRTNSKIKEFIS